MNVEEIKQAVDAGEQVCWVSLMYRVIKDKLGRYLIVCQGNQSAIGLTWLDGTTLNGVENQFFIEGAQDANT